MNTTLPRIGLLTLETAFQRARAEGRPALITYLTIGYPSPNATLDLAPALQAGGADIIELGVPFSDPVADGPAIQRASYVALQAGMTPARCLEIASALRDRGVYVPLVLMGYYNPIFAYGLPRYVHDCVEAGVNGLIVPDLPLEEASLLRQACELYDLSLILLVAPTTEESRLERIAAAARGFLYVVARLGSTGAHTGLGPELTAQLTRARQYAHTPIAVGFGISTPEQVRSLAPLTDGIVVGSAIGERAGQGAAALRDYVQTLRDACR